MKKRLLALLLAASVLLLSGCTFFESFSTYISDLKKVSNYKYYGYNSDHTPNYEFNDEVLTAIDERFGQLDEILSSNDIRRNAAFQQLYMQQLNDLYYLSDHANLMFVQFCRDPSNEEVSDKYQNMTRLVNEKSARLYRMYRPIYDSVYGTPFFEQWDEDEIEKALLMSDRYSDEFVELTDKVDEYVQNYEKLVESARNYGSESAKIYKNIVSENILIAKEAEYEQYADYAYEYVYGRDFSPADADNFYTCVKNYIIPLGKQLLTSLRNYKRLDAVEKYRSALVSDSYSEEELKMKLTPYSEALGNGSGEAFENFLNHYVAVSSVSARTQAFTFFLNYYGHPTCYFGPGYQSLMTYVHEQGHYLSMYRSEGPIESVDLNETQSQANEWLFLSYIKGDYRETDYQYMIREFLLFDILSLVLSTCCDAFEQYIYQHPELSYTEYDKAFVNVAKSLDAYDFLAQLMSGKPEEYWHRAIVSNSFYYLSYAVSLIPVIELYVISEEQGFDAAAEIYGKLTKVSDSDAPFVETVVSCGLTSPFEESVFKRIVKHFE